MKYILSKSFLLGLLVVLNISCKEDNEFSELVRDNRPTIPVTYPGTTSYGFNPYITSSLGAGGAIQFTLSIPSSSGRTIKEITRILGGGTGITVANLNAATAATLYNAAPIAGSGNTVVFNTTIADFNKKYPNVATTPVALPNYTEIQFIFLITLDDNTQIVPVPVRVRVVA